jgi:hypothetical protein
MFNIHKYPLCVLPFHSFNGVFWWIKVLCLNVGCHFFPLVILISSLKKFPIPWSYKDNFYFLLRVLIFQLLYCIFQWKGEQLIENSASQEMFLRFFKACSQVLWRSNEVGKHWVQLFKIIVLVRGVIN